MIQQLITKNNKGQLEINVKIQEKILQKFKIYNIHHQKIIKSSIKIIFLFLDSCTITINFNKKYKKLKAEFKIEFADGVEYVLLLNYCDILSTTSDLENFLEYINTKLFYLERLLND